MEAEHIEEKDKDQGGERKEGIFAFTFLKGRYLGRFRIVRRSEGTLSRRVTEFFPAPNHVSGRWPPPKNPQSLSRSDDHAHSLREGSDVCCEEGSGACRGIFTGLSTGTGASSCIIRGFPHVLLGYEQVSLHMMAGVALIREDSLRCLQGQMKKQ